VIDITVKNVDVPALREQRNALLTAIEDIEGLHGTASSFQLIYREQQVKNLDGLVSLLNTMLDNAEGVND
jgi:hypothetical protein